LDKILNYKNQKLKITTAKLLFFSFLIILKFNSCSTDSNQVGDLDSYMKDRIKDKNISGLSAAIIKGDSINWIGSYGYANIETESLMTDKSILNIGSVSKVFTATAIMQLWENKQIDLNRDIRAYLNLDIKNPKYPNDSITVKQLLTHTSSIIDSKVYQQSYQCGESKLSLKNWISDYLLVEGKYYNSNENFSENKPNSKKEYSNVGYGVLGLIVEQMSGKPFNQFCKENIFSPLGMKDTGWFINEIDNSRHAKPTIYITAENKKSISEFENILSEFNESKINYFQTTCLYSFPNYPDGLLRTSTKDLSKFLIAILNNGENNNNKILNSATINMMLTPQIEGNKKQGLCLSYTGFENVWGHGGDGPGIQAGMYFNPDLKIGLIMLQNSNEGNRTDLLKKLYMIAKR